MGDANQALATLETTVKLKPNYIRAHQVLGSEYSKLGEYQLALEHYRFVLDNLDPDNIKALEAVKNLEATT